MNTSTTTHIFLAEDDDDDSFLFNEVLKEFSPVKLTIARNGENLMKVLKGLTTLPDVLFLDLNMPLKNGFDCLLEIKQCQRLKDLPVIIFSTSAQAKAISEVYDAGAHFFVRKPDDFSSFKKIVHFVLSVNWKNMKSQPPKDKFVLSV